MHIGYARVSRITQDTARQRAALVDAACVRIFEDDVFGAKKGAARPGLAAALDYARPGDTLVIWRLDRLGRDLPDLITQVAALQARGLHLVSLQEPLDTTRDTGVFPLFAALATFERNVIRERTAAGRQTARAILRRRWPKTRIYPDLWC